ncbi:glycosyltransferase [Actinopolymorpha rutila]|uniref:Glycosyltransferase involved in cell wall biosynthesis n=1 Tax=Actinopolymorpha rutila TaxID=446787 RepID=A0A852ZHG4_9ACTN|nr:glycosyltransferase [Actinopolymorpha rutila]NYH87726.1 glycosyltransferase involved in cell wall biosynthesis [Actinopolymorpha rutila]
MSPSRVLIDASNLHHGGGLQVATSFLSELAALRADPGEVAACPWLRDVDIEVSPAVSANLADAGVELPLRVVRPRGPARLSSWVPNRSRAEVSFVVLGPEYFAARARRRIVGYADVTSVYPRPAGVPPHSRGSRIKWAARGIVSRRLLKRADRVVVETEAFADATRRRIPALSAPVDVVPNCVNRTLLEQCPVPRSTTGVRTRLLYVARAYAHKNHELLGQVGEELTRRGQDVEFAVTLSEEEWKARTLRFRCHCVNLGPLPVSGLAKAYAQADAVVFPSLLEAFSAAPVEGVAAGRVVFASDRDFVRTTCGDAVVYADPLDPDDWADRIEEWLRSPEAVEATIREAAQAMLDSMSGPGERAREYVRIIDEEFRRAR